MQFRHLIHTLDYHHGQASRTIMSGYPPIPGRTMAEKAAFYDRHLSWIHRSLIREPRGHANMLGSIITEPVSPEAVVGVLYLHAEGQFEMCGDSAFATAHAVLENGMVPTTEPWTDFAMDTVAGPVRVRAGVENGKVLQVSIENVPAFYLGDRSLRLPNKKALTLEIAYGGLYYAFVDAGTAGLPLVLENGRALIGLGMEIIQKANADPDIRTMDPSRETAIQLVTFYEPLTDGTADYRVCNIYPPGRMGRTPSGTGLSAHMALRRHKKTLALHQDLIQKSMVGTTFTGRLTDSRDRDGHVCYTPVISAKSYLMGIHQFVIDPDDPFKEGFMMPY